MTKDSLPVPARRAAVEAYDFRLVHPRAVFGTASDRYAAWIGQIYPDTWRSQITTRRKGDVEERLLPIASIGDYFQHFGVLELDFTFYQPLLTPNGQATPAFHTLRQYAEHAPAGARFLAKVPQVFFAPRLRRSVAGQVQYADNPAYLDADAFRRQFYDPALATLGDHLAGLLFEQEYARQRDTPEPEAFIADLDRFFADVPREVPLHVELRSAHLLVPAYLAWLEHQGLGFGFSHWTWLPPIKDQWRLTDRRFSDAHRTAVLRLLNPREMRYEEAFRLAYPFEDAVPALAGTAQARQMVDEATALLYQALEADVTLFIIANNRAWGNSPKLAQAVAHRFLDFADRRHA